MTVEVCPICDIFGCRHIRERNAMTASNSHEETDMIMPRDAVRGLLGGCVVRSSLEGTLARSLLAAHDEIKRLRANADVVAALAIEEAAKAAEPTVADYQDEGGAEWRSGLITAAMRIRALTPASGVARLAELRGRAEKAEADLRESLAVNKRLNTWLDGDTAALVAERDTLAADNARLAAQVAGLTGALAFYADVQDYHAPFTGTFGKLWQDCGETARAALSAHDAKAGEGTE